MAQIILALDDGNLHDIEGLLAQLDPNTCKIKIGNILFTQYGPALLQLIRSYCFDIFLDLKYHDIPNTVNRAVLRAIDQGVWMVNIHLMGGTEMVRAAAQAAQNSAVLLIGVTSLTSFSPGDAQVLFNSTKELLIDKLAGLAFHEGLHGVVCPGVDALRLKQKYGNNFLTVVPGVRLAGDAAQDHQIAYTPFWAANNGADYLVLGRSITQHAGPQRQIAAVLSSLGQLHEANS